MCETYSAMGPENKFAIECATSLGTFLNVEANKLRIILLTFQGSTKPTIIWSAQRSSSIWEVWPDCPMSSASWSVTSRQTPFCLLWSKQNTCRSNYYHHEFSEDTQLLDSSIAQKEVNVEMLRYFDPCQLLVSRAATLLAFISPHLRGESNNNS